MKKTLFLFSATLSIFLLSAILPMPLFSKQTNITNSQASKINDYHESEVAPTNSTSSKILTISWTDGINNLFTPNQVFELIVPHNQSIITVKRIGGTNHVDFVAIDAENQTKLDQLILTQTLPALAKINEQTFLPASIYSYQHGYQNHYCMHFKNSKTDGTKKEDAFHQKNISHILKNKSKFLKIANMA